MGLTTPVYFSAGLTQRANAIYRTFISWTNEKIKETFTQRCLPPHPTRSQLSLTPPPLRNMFAFPRIQPFDRALISTPTPLVLFASPGMLHGGLSLEVFRQWASNKWNLVVIPGYCAAGTVGHKLYTRIGKTGYVRGGGGMLTDADAGFGREGEGGSEL
jgi:integrator complex subunit 11